MVSTGSTSGGFKAAVRREATAGPSPWVSIRSPEKWEERAGRLQDRAKVGAHGGSAQALACGGERPAPTGRFMVWALPADTVEKGVAMDLLRPYSRA
jgi:hypothetical protein